jgi:hypothetical protein
MENINIEVSEKEVLVPSTKVIKKWIKKDGSITEKEYDQKAYSQKHYEKNKDKYLSKHMCLCGIEYSPSNKHNHLVTRIHKLYEKMSSMAVSI